MSLSECGAQNQQGPQPKRQAPLQNLPECQPLCFTAVGFAENNHGTDDTPEQKAAVNQRSALVGVTEPGGTVGSHRHTQNDPEDYEVAEADGNVLAFIRSIQPERTGRRFELPKEIKADRETTR